MTARAVTHASSAAAAAPPARDILGVRVEPLSFADAIRELEQRIRQRRFTKVCFLNAHSSNLASRHEDYAAAMDDFLVLADGVGVDLASLLLHGSNFPANLNGTDFVPAFLKAQDRRIKVGLLGTTRRNVESAAQCLRAMTPQHDVFVIADGFFSEDEDGPILERLRHVRPDVLLVAMGVPRQELWISRRLSGEHCTVAFAVGALLDFLGGAVPRAPLWVRQARLEWFFRLMHEPSRLWRRYIIGNPLFVLRVLRRKFGWWRPRR